MTPGSGFIYMSWDQVLPSGANSLELYNDGPNTLLHELLHHLGLRHTFTTIASGDISGGDDYSNEAGASGNSCLKDGDYGEAGRRRCQVSVARRSSARRPRVVTRGPSGLM